MNSYMPPSQMNSQMNSAAGTAGSYRWFIFAFSQKKLTKVKTIWVVSGVPAHLGQLGHSENISTKHIFPMFTAALYCYKSKGMQKDKISIEPKRILPFMCRA